VYLKLDDLDRVFEFVSSLPEPAWTFQGTTCSPSGVQHRCCAKAINPDSFEKYSNLLPSGLVSQGSNSQREQIYLDKRSKNEKEADPLYAVMAFQDE
jgi:hypothetical protein